MASDLTIDRVESWACRVPLPKPISFGNFTVRERHYACVRISTRGGLFADCIGHTRGSPVDLAISDIFAPVLIGKDAMQLGSRLADMERATLPIDSDGVIGRARSMIDICLWDLRAKVHDVPLWLLLGGAPRRLPVLLVEGYRQEDEDDEDIADRLIARHQEGFRFLKLEAAQYGDPGPIARILTRAGRESSYVCDLAWSWRTARQGLAAAECWKELGLAWIEDPMPRGRTAELAFLRAHSPVPIGIGDEASRAADLEGLMDRSAVDVVRIDATTIGGYSVAAPLAIAAVARGYRVSFHVHPEFHRHLAFAMETADHVEMFPTDRPFDASHMLLQSAAFDEVSDGFLTPPDGPGSGVELDLAAVKRFAHRHAART